MKKIYSFILLVVIIILFFRDCSIKKKEINIISNPNSLDVLVNKFNKLNSEYIPSDLILMPLKNSNKDKYLRKEAADNFIKLSNDASLLNYKIIIASAYRSYEYQTNLYDDYKEKYDFKYTSSCCAQAGFSEHQTGLAIDVMGSNNDYHKFDESQEFNWMINNCYKYGFILRYPKGKEKITGFKYEPWHYRYVGVKLAIFLHQKNITLEEYHKKKEIK
ncbi:MAG: M15 family metallopeptidase [Bacilli bacterium]|nr:M15 family metallopeptidase [Bacilli bacterium]